MGQRDDRERSRGCGERAAPAHDREEGPGRLAKAVRATSAIVVFGIPMVTAAAALIGCGINIVYRRIVGRH